MDNHLQQVVGGPYLPLSFAVVAMLPGQMEFRGRNSLLTLLRHIHTEELYMNADICKENRNNESKTKNNVYFNITN